MSLTAPGAEGISPDITLGEYANWWLERRKDELSASYYVNCQTAIKDIAASIGGYKLRELNPTIIQRFYDQLDKKEKTVTTVTAKPELREAMQEAKMGFRKLRWVHKVCDAAGLPHRTVHSLRHTNITMQIAAGVPLVTVAGRAGHARTSTTTDIYSHFLKSSDKTAAEKLEQLFE